MRYLHYTQVQVSDSHLNIMTRRLRLILAITILTISILLLIWGLAPSRRETRIQEIFPSEMQLPTPEALRFPLEAAL